MTLGVTIGKFYPFHIGHDLLIREAKARVGSLVVLCCGRPEQSPPADVRARWIRDQHPDVEVLEVVDDLPEEPQPWAVRTLQVLGGRRPEVAFTAEDYGDAWSSHMGARHVRIDSRPRGVSGSVLRQDLAAHWDWLTPPAKAWFAKRICVLGVESSGSTTLAQDLARYYRTVWVPEHGRYYWEGRRFAADSDRWETQEFVRIARAQQSLEDDLARLANQVVICDTDALATHVWHRRYMGYFDDQILQVALARPYDLYLLTAPDFGFVQDGTREGEDLRAEMHEWFVQVLEATDRPHVLVSGDSVERLQSAVSLVDDVVVFPPLETDADNPEDPAASA